MTGVVLGDRYAERRLYRDREAVEGPRRRLSRPTSSIRAGTVALLLFFFASLLLPPSSLLAQDAHYWTMQYGPTPSLLGGAVIGSVNDVSATYYNPGALRFADNLALAVSTNVFETKRISLENGGGDGVDLGTSRTGLRPSMIAGTLTDSLWGNSVLSYSVLTRMKSDTELKGSLLRSGDDLENLSALGASFELNTRISETWGGLTYARSIGSNFGVGLSWYGAVRTEQRRIQELSQLIESENKGLLLQTTQNTSTVSIRTLAKLGAYFEAEAFTAGMTITTPSLQAFGVGEMEFIHSFAATDSVSLIAGIQKDLSATYTSPLSVGAGLGFPVGRARVHASTEWFNYLDRYVVIEGEDLVGPVPSDAVVPQIVYQELGHVVNWGVGVEYNLKPDLNLYGSFYTDNSALPDDLDEPVISLISVDIKTVTVGADFRIGPALLTLGVGRGWGNHLAEGLSDLVGGPDQDVQVVQAYSNWIALFGFELIRN